ncbi:MAG: hypothetical protein M1835_007192 [Candelina submexicana]|nr:MAG: hypothetical protein M1835_007192 [Candelina submexicana]
MGEPNQLVSSLVTEHLRYTPLSLIDDIINSINGLVYKAVTAVEQGLLAAPPTTLGFGQASSNSIPDTDGDGNIIYPEATQEIENGVHQLETLLEATVDKTFDKLEIILLRSVLTVPEDIASWVRLGHYENLSITQQADAPTPESINLQRRKLQETQKLHAALLGETSQNAALIVQLKSLLSSAEQGPARKPKIEDAENTHPSTTKQGNSTFAFLTEDASSKELGVGNRGQKPLTTNVNFALSQLPAMRSLLAILKPKLSLLPATTAIDIEAPEEERRHYIESQTRRHLESTRGLDLDAQGQNRDGEWQGGGRRMGAEEVGAIEGIVNMLQSGHEHKDAQADPDVMEES